MPPASRDRAALAALKDALGAVMGAAVGASPAVARRIREGLAAHAEAVETARATTDPVQMPLTTFDPSDPEIVGRMVSLALIAQPRAPLADVRQAYGSGVYAIYYHGSHPLYAGITGTETPIYIGKADPANHDASTPREQGPRLTGRLLEHAGIITIAETYARNNGLSPGLHSIQLSDFSCRALVCATNAQLAAENHLIRMFLPIWNRETNACWGLSKHGDSAGTRGNKRSPWHVVHPGKPDFLDARLVDSLTPDEICEKIKAVLIRVPPRTDYTALLNEMLDAFRQGDLSKSDEIARAPIGPDASGPNEHEAGDDN